MAAPHQLISFVCRILIAHDSVFWLAHQPCALLSVSVSPRENWWRLHKDPRGDDFTLIAQLLFRIVTRYIGVGALVPFCFGLVQVRDFRRVVPLRFLQRASDP